MRKVFWLCGRLGPLITELALTKKSCVAITTYRYRQPGGGTYSEAAELGLDEPALAELTSGKLTQSESVGQRYLGSSWRR